MPITPPALDDRSFDDLVSELVARIPAHTPEWTNPRQGDPGRTLIDLFAWLGDTMLYRANLVPERQRLAFLRLLGMPMEAAVAAQGLVALKVKADLVPIAVDVAASAAIDKPVPFTSLQFCTAFPLTGKAYIKRALTSDEIPSFNQLLPDLQAVYGRRDGTPIGYVTSEIFANGAALTSGVDVIADSVDAAVWVALMAPSAKLQAAARNTLNKSADGSPRALNVGIALAYDIVPLDEDVGQRVQIPVVWEMSTGLSGLGQPAMVTLEPLLDTTQQLSRHGVVRLSLPPLAMIGAPSNDPRENLQAGVGDSPPRIDSPDDADKLIAWLRLRVAPGYAIESLKLAWIGLNACEVEQREPVPDRAVGVSDGGSDQVFDLGLSAKGSVDPGTLDVIVDDTVAGSARWAPIDDLGSAGPLDAVYSFDAEAGTVRFGDGVHGRVPSGGSRIVATHTATVAAIRVGGGAQGNLPAGTLAKLDSLVDLVTGQRHKPDVAIEVLQPLATQGGADAEQLGAAERRIPAFFRHRDRAVTGGDYRALAHEAQGVEVGRVEVLPLFKPQERQGDVPGVVSVMALPSKATVDYSAPYPRADRPLLETLYNWLADRRPLATELYLIGCAYQPLGVTVAVQIRDGHAREQVLSDVRIALRRFLWPLPIVDGSATEWPETLSSDGGYPLGRAVTDRELEVVVARVAGVDGVAPVRLFGGQTGSFVPVASAANGIASFTLAAWELPELTALAVVEDTTAPNSVTQPYGSVDAGNQVFLPVVPALC